MDRAETPLMSHHVFRVAIIGCPNCCMSPYFADVGIIAVYTPGVRSRKCIYCGSCETGCSEKAIQIVHDPGPVIDRERCVACGACEGLCPEGALYTAAQGYKVAVGGTGSRHPRLARTVVSFTDREGVLGILKNAVAVYKNASADQGERPFHDIIKEYGNDILTKGVAPAE
jgi:dissimilatory sulfite reductase (desulfoviridin) alpha/beta subunit